MLTGSFLFFSLLVFSYNIIYSDYFLKQLGFRFKSVLFSISLTSNLCLSYPCPLPPPPSPLSGCLKILYMRNHILSSNTMSLVHSDCYKKKPKTEWLGKNQMYFLHFWNLGRRWSVWWGHASCFMDGHLFIMSLHGRKGKGSLWCLFFKCTNITYEGSVLMAQSPLKNHTSK